MSGWGSSPWGSSPWGSEHYLKGVIGLIAINNIELTEHNRQPLEISNRQLASTFDMVIGSSKVFCVSDDITKKTFTISWKNIPGNQGKTLDNRAARDIIKSLAMQTNELNFLYIDSDGVKVYTVYVDSYSETLNKRYLNSFYWDVDLSLTEK